MWTYNEYQYNSTGVCSVLQLWVQERNAVATSTDHGHNLQTVQLLIKKNQVREPNTEHVLTEPQRTHADVDQI